LAKRRDIEQAMKGQIGRIKSGVEEVPAGMVVTSATQLTILRIAFVPLFVILVVYGRLGGAVAVFLLAGATDLLDGFIARRYKQKTVLGTLLDPVADKMLLVSSFIVLSVGSAELTVPIPLWLTATVIGRDILIILGVAAVNLTVGRRVFLPSILGKATTGAQLVTVFVFLVSNFLLYRIPFLTAGLVYLTFILTVLSALHYLARETRLFEYNREET
jgi:cardiolipin synthase (CMP-forming)